MKPRFQPGSPHWTRFELPRANWHCERTYEHGAYQKDWGGMPIVVHATPRAWACLDLAVLDPSSPQAATVESKARALQRLAPLSKSRKAHTELTTFQRGRRIPSHRARRCRRV